MKHLEDLIYWINERESIRRKKHSDYPRPWTDDHILTDYRFCNVYREDDVVTQWIHTNWLDSNIYADSLPMAMAVARMTNWVPTLETLGYPHTWDAKHFKQVLGARRRQGLKSWTSAYMITGGYSAGGEYKEDIIARVLTALHEKLRVNPIKVSDSLEAAAVKLRSPGIGTFLVGQIIADLKHSNWLRDAKDWNTWCAVGPGSTAGLNFLHERKQLTVLNAQDFRREVNELQPIILAETGYGLCAQNTQNCLCEFSKYVRTKYYGGRPKSAYTPAKRVEAATLPPRGKPPPRACQSLANRMSAPRLSPRYRADKSPYETSRLPSNSFL